jgi:subtilisin family serine protease
LIVIKKNIVILQRKINLIKVMMKKTFMVVIVISITLLAIFNASGQNSKYYYSYNVKKYLNEVPNKLVITYDTVYHSNIANALSSNSNVQSVQWVNRQNAVVITTNSNQNKSLVKLECLEMSGIKSVQPLYATVMDGAELKVTDEILVRFNDNVSFFQKVALQNQYNLSLKRNRSRFSVYSVPANLDPLEVANAIQESGLVVFSHPNFLSKITLNQVPPADEYFNNQYNLYNTGQTLTGGYQGTAGADINVMPAWNITKGNANIVIAVLDNGVTPNHPDIPNTHQIRLTGSDFITGDNDPSPESDDTYEAHGTSCAGLIVATHNNEGIAGIAPNCKIMPVRMLYNTGDTSTQEGNITSAEYISEAITFANENGAHIISNSWSYDGITDPNYLPSIVDAITDAINDGKVVIFSASNTANISAYSPNGVISFPANMDGVIAVGASDRNDNKAIYSPISNYSLSTNQVIDIVAPSGSIWTTDIPGNGGDNPSYSNIPNSGTNYLAYTHAFSGTSAACPQVAGVVALMLSVNPNLTSQQVTDILEQTARKAGPYNYQTITGFPNGTRCNELGYGVVDAYAAVAKALESLPAADLYIRDCTNDDGSVPSNAPDGVIWDSPDIWVEYDGTQNNPVGGEPCTIKVRIHNKSTINYSSNTETLSLYWAKAGVDQLWSSSWDGSSSFNCGVKTGAFISTVNIPAIAPQGERIIEINWIPPFPQEYVNCTEFENGEQWHFCLAAVVDNGKDPLIINAPEMWIMTTQNNNFAWKNITISDPAKDGIIPSGLISFSNPEGIGNIYPLKLKFKAKENIAQEYITDKAEVKLKLSANLYNAWLQGGARSTAIKDLGQQQILIMDTIAELTNISLPIGQNEFVLAETYFLTQRPSLENTFEFDLIETLDDDFIVGGEHYLFTRIPDNMRALANNTETIVQGESLELQSLNSESNVSYGWYNNEQQIDSTQTTIVLPQTSTTYVLEVIRDENGNKDYDTVNVVVKKGMITAINPNPANDLITITYKLGTDVSAATFKITNSIGVVVATASADVQLTEKQIYIGSFPTGNYLVELVSNNEVIDSKTIIKL